MNMTTTSRMTALSDDPWISVSDLGEYAFCPRAGLLAHEAARDDSGVEPDHRPGPRTFFDVESLRRKIDDLEMERKSLATIRNGSATVLAIAMVILYFAWTSVAALLLPVIAVAALPFGITQSKLVRNRQEFERYNGMLQLALQAIASVPQPNHLERVPVDWWQLLQGGCESIKSRDQLRDPKWKICGKPWRILVYRGTKKFPVFRMKLRRKKEYNDVGWYEWIVDKRIFHQHIIRTAAYSHLLEVCENAHSPYGIVMFGATYEGTTIPVSNSQKKKFHDVLLSFRASIRDTREGKNPDKPSSTHICKGCPWGRPEGFWIFKKSVCGKRFRWRPPYSNSD